MNNFKTHNQLIKTIIFSLVFTLFFSYIPISGVVKAENMDKESIQSEESQIIDVEGVPDSLDEPTDPVDSVEPTDPIDPENPEGSVVPTDPVDPTNPIDSNIPITDYLEYTIQYYFTTFDGEDVKREIIEEVSFDDPIVTFENLPKPKDLPEGYVIDEKTSTKLPFTVTEEDNEIEVYYIPSTPKFLEYTIYYLFTTLDGEDVEGEMKGEVSSADPVVTVDNLPMPEDLPMGYVIDEENSRLPYKVTEVDNEIYVYYIPGMMSIMPMALVNPGPNNYVIAPETSLLNLTGSSTNDHSQAVMAWYDAGGEFYIAVQSTHVLDGTMTLYKDGSLYAFSDDTHIYPVLGNLIVDGQSYSPKVKYYSAGQITGNTEDARWSVYVFNNANVTSGQYTFDVKGIGGGHDIKGRPLTIAIPKTDVTATKEWIGGTTPRPTIKLQLYRNILGGTPEPIGVEKELSNGNLSAIWTGLEKTDGTGKNYIFTVKEVSNPPGYQASYDGLKVTNTYKVGELSITKNVTGNLRDTSKAFKISITFTSPEGLVDTTIRYKDPSGVYTDYILKNLPKEKTIEIELKDGQTGIFENIPYGVSYEVLELNAEGYVIDINNGTGNIIKEDTSVVVTNNINAEIDTGILLDFAPYIFILALVATGGLWLFIRKRKQNDFNQGRDIY